MTATAKQQAPANVLAGVWARITPLTVATGSGAWVTTTDDEHYLDFTAGIAVCATGHCHPDVVAAIREQAGRILHAQVNVYHHDLLAPLAARLAELTPDSIERFFFTNSGAEAVEAAVKLAKQATGRTGVIVFSGSFHGRTHLTAAMTTSKSTYRVGAAPLPAGITVAPFPDLAHAADPEAEIDRAIAELRLILDSYADPRDTAAMIIEPVQGEGGYRPVPPRFMEAIAGIAAEHGILFIADEVQSGFGRTGTFFATEQYDVQPDIMVLAKGLASGMPLSAIGARSDVMERWITGSHGGTYGGNPVSCAASLATIEVLSAPGVLETSLERAGELRAALDRIAETYAGVTEVRGLGLMLGIEFNDPAVSATLMAACFERKLIVTTAGHQGRTLRWMPPVTVTKAEMATAIAILEDAAAATLTAK